MKYNIYFRKSIRKHHVFRILFVCIKEIVQKVPFAKTIGDVMQCSGKFEGVQDTKVAYRKLTLLLHPDKNLHEGATQAFKKLQY